MGLGTVSQQPGLHEASSRALAGEPPVPFRTPGHVALPRGRLGCGLLMPSHTLQGRVLCGRGRAEALRVLSG